MFSKEYIIYLFIIAVGFFTGLFNFNKFNSIKPIIILLGITLVSECLSRVLAYEIKNSNPPYHFLSPLQSLLWGAFFKKEFETKNKKNIFFYLCVLIAALSLLNTLFFQNIFIFPDNILKIQSFGFITIGFILFIEKLEESSEKNIFRDPGFLIAVSLIWFNLISFIFFNFHNYLLKKLLLGNSLRVINYISNYGYYLLLALAIILPLLKYGKQENKTLDEHH